MDKQQKPTPEEVAQEMRRLGLHITYYDNSGFLAALKLHLSERMLDVEEIEDVVKRRVAERSLTDYVEELRGVILDIEKRLLRINLYLE